MENLLRNDFTFHFGLPASAVADLVITTNDSYFEIEDAPNRELVLHTLRGGGMARFSNPRNLNITIANYDKFITSLPASFQNGKKRCDMIMVCDTNLNFIIGEIKDSPKVDKHRYKAKKQLLQSLKTLLAVPNIMMLIESKSVKKCCYFNKQSSAPIGINAVSAFNRLTSFYSDGFQMSYPEVEALGFQFWEFSGSHYLTL